MDENVSYYESDEKNNTKIFFFWNLRRRNGKGNKKSYSKWMCSLRNSHTVIEFLSFFCNFFLLFFVSVKYSIKDILFLSMYFFFVFFVFFRLCESKINNTRIHTATPKNQKALCQTSYNGPENTNSQFLKL